MAAVALSLIPATRAERSRRDAERRGWIGIPSEWSLWKKKKIPTRMSQEFGK